MKACMGDPCAMDLSVRPARPWWDRTGELDRDKCDA